MKKLSQFEAEQSELVKHYQQLLRDKDKVLEDWQAERGSLEAFFGEMFKYVHTITPKPRTYDPKTPTKSTEIKAVLHNTDWHIGERQEQDEIEGLNEFNFEIATNRVNDLSHRFNRLVDRTRLSYVINHLVIIVTGDMQSGDIHLELQRTNEFPVPVQVVRSANLFVEEVAYLAQNFETVTVEYITADNHGRLTKKPQAKEQGMNSFNYLCAIIAKQSLAKHENVIFNTHTAPQKVIDVHGRKYLCMHGHQIRGWAGIPFYGMERKASKESRKRLALIMEQNDLISRLGYHKIVAGHFHTKIDTDFYSFAGSLSGTNAYDHEDGRYGAPSQPGWFVHPRYGEFGRVDFKL